MKRCPDCGLVHLWDGPCGRSLAYWEGLERDAIREKQAARDRWMSHFGGLADTERRFEESWLGRKQTSHPTPSKHQPFDAARAQHDTTASS